MVWMTSRALYPGSFYPLTIGHVDIIRRVLATFDGVVVAVANNPAKRSMFTLEERVALVEAVFDNDPRIEVRALDGLLVDYARLHGTHVIVRGLRAVADFEYEYQMAAMNRSLAPEIETMFLMADPSTFFVSSRLAKEVASLGGDIAHVVPPAVYSAVQAKLRLTPDDTESSP